MVWIVLVVIGMILLVGWLALGQFGTPASEGVADPMTPTPVAPAEPDPTLPPPP